MARNSNPDRPESLAEVRKDDALLDALGGRTNPPPKGDELTDLLAAWNDEVGA